MVVTGRVTGDEEEDAPVGAANGLGELLQPVGTVTVGQGKGDDPQENDPNIDGIFGLTQDGAPYFFPWHTVESLNAPGVPTGKSTSGRREGNGWEIAVTR